MTVKELAAPRSNGRAAEPIAHWWQEARSSVKAGHISRARRYLRWILAVCPENEAAWLWLARLAASHAARLAYLKKAATFHPHSSQVQISLREARNQQLQASVGQLEKRPANLCRLPRHSPRPPAEDTAPTAEPEPLRHRVSALLKNQPALRTLHQAARDLPARLAALLPAAWLPAALVPVRGARQEIEPAQVLLDLDDLILQDHVPGLIRVGERFAIVQTVSPPIDGMSYGDPRAALRAVAFERWLVQSRECAQIEIYIRLESNRSRITSSPPPAGQNPVAL